MSPILVRSTFKKKGYTVCKQLDIGVSSLHLKPHTKHLILFMHAFTGCDTTSGIYEKGKGSIVRLIEQSPDAQSVAEVFMNGRATKEQIGDAGCKMFVLLYGGRLGNSLSSTRHRNYREQPTPIVSEFGCR